MIHANGGTAAGARVQTRQRKPDEPLHRQGCLRQRLAPAPGSDWSQERLPPAVTRAESALLLEPSEQWVLSLLSSHFKVERGLGCRGIVVSPPRPIAPPSFIPLDQAARAPEWGGGRVGRRDRVCENGRRHCTLFPAFSPQEDWHCRQASALPRVLVTGNSNQATCSDPKFWMPIHGTGSTGLDASCVVIHAHVLLFVDFLLKLKQISPQRADSLRIKEQCVPMACG